MFKPKLINLDEKFDKTPLKDQFNDIMQNFNFALVAMIMASPCKPIYKWDIINSDDAEDYMKVVGYMPWKMYMTDSYKVPNEEELRSLASKLLNDVIDYSKGGENYYSVATGPFKVTYSYGSLILEFIMESWG